MSFLYMIFGTLDAAIYSLISLVLRIVVDLSYYSFFSQESIKKIQKIVYIALGVLMLFKLVISALQYLVNPDVFDDKSKGMGAVLKKMVISVVLLAVVPTIFDFAIYIQRDVVEAIPRIFFHQNINANIENIGNEMAGETMQAFIQPKDPNKTPQLKSGMDIWNHIRDGCEIDNIFSKKYWSGEDCKYSYSFGISTAVGLFMVFVLGSMTVDVGIRTIKLGIIQIFAPIPIANYITDEKKFNSWVKTSLQVYADLFIRLFVIYFIVMMIQMVIGDFQTTTGYPKDMVDQLGRTPSTIEALYIKVFIVIALLIFAKNAPKFICDLLGFDSSGEGITAMFKRAGGLLGTTMSGFKTARSNYNTQKERAISKGQKFPRLSGLKSAAAGMGSATARGLWMSGQGKGFNEVRQNAFKNAIGARDRRIDRVDNMYGEDYGYLDYRRDVRREKLGIPSDVAFIKTRYDTMEQIAKFAAEAKGHGTNKMNETPNRYQISFMKKDDNGNLVFKDKDFETINKALGVTSLSMEQVRNFYTMARNGQMVNGKRLKQEEIDALGSLVQTIEKRTSYLKEAELMGTGDPAASPNVDKLFMAIKNNETMFNSAEIMNPIIQKMQKDLKNYIPDKNNPNVVVIDGRNFDVSKSSGVLGLISELQSGIKEPDRKDYTTDADYNKAMSDYMSTIELRADILTGVKDSFEEVAKQQYKGAQIADARAKKAQQAISNNEKKG